MERDAAGNNNMIVTCRPFLIGILRGVLVRAGGSPMFLFCFVFCVALCRVYVPPAGCLALYYYILILTKYFVLIIIRVILDSNFVWGHRARFLFASSSRRAVS